MLTQCNDVGGAVNSPHPVSLLIDELDHPGTPFSYEGDGHRLGVTHPCLFSRLCPSFGLDAEH